MKRLYDIGCVVSMALVATGLFFLYRSGLFGTSESIGILGLFSGLSLNLGLQVSHLRGRIAALEKREPE